MKTIIIAFTAIVVLTACGASKKAATKYQVLNYQGKKMLKGIINRSQVESDTAFAWFKENMQYGQPDAAAVAAFRQHKADFTMIVFGGTWCEDTQNLLPKFYKLVDKSGYPESSITLVAVDRQKTTFNNLHTTYNIANVPTFIVLKAGKEIGRVVEYGKDGDMVKELGAIVSKL
ncbi:MAG: thioredoxin family protein [Flavobacterium sp.]|nr:thioredoxin family protein [Flavobacterium sp.]